MESTTIPFLDLTTPHLELEQELLSVFGASLRSAAFIGGPEVEGFEREFAWFCTARHGVGVGSGIGVGVGRGTTRSEPNPELTLQQEVLLPRHN